MKTKFSPIANAIRSIVGPGVKIYSDPRTYGRRYKVIIYIDNLRDYDSMQIKMAAAVHKASADVKGLNLLSFQWSVLDRGSVNGIVQFECTAKIFN